MADTKSRKSLLAWVVAVWSRRAALGGLSQSYAMLLAIRLGIGIGEAVCAPAATIWIGEAVKPEHRMPAMAGFMMAVPVAIMLSFALGGLASQAFG